VIKKMFLWLLEVSTVNSYLLYVLVQEQCGKKPVTHKEFKQSLVESLMHARVSASGGIQKAEQGSGARDKRLNGEPHFTERKERGVLLVLYVNQTNCGKKQYITASRAEKAFLAPCKMF
jgi:hypothetical protein